MKNDKKKDAKTARPTGEQKKKPQGAEQRKPGSQQALPLDPDVSQDSVDVTGITPEDIRVDPDITEGHPGYEESGRSEPRVPK